MSDYQAFLASKLQLESADGFEALWVPDFLFDFQKRLVEWALWQGRAALFADCGLGKTPMALVWAQNVVQKTNGRVLILTPLAVGQQFQSEGEKFGIEVRRSRDGSVRGPITVTNYEQLEKFDPDRFAGVVCDESSAIKSFDSVTRGQVTEFMRRLRYRLLCTATAAPNDYIELGTSSEALGHLGFMDMLSRFFINKENTSQTNGHWIGFHRPRAWEPKQWRFKHHAEEPFWRWLASWARALRRPSDLGFSDDGFTLPPLRYRRHLVEATVPREGMLFDLPALGLREEREEQRRTIRDRCERAAEVLSRAERAVCWCHLNDESTLLTRLIPGAVEVRGSDPAEQKEDALSAFTRGQVRVLVTKPAIGAWGLNWQHCHRVVYFPSHSYEQHYQAVRRCWRFGQRHTVTVDLITTHGSAGMLASLERKSKQADRMFDQLVAHMRDAVAIRRTDRYEIVPEVPQWAS